LSTQTEACRSIEFARYVPIMSSGEGYGPKSWGLIPGCPDLLAKMKAYDRFLRRHRPQYIAESLIRQKTERIKAQT
jgi:hypothetical protein